MAQRRIIDHDIRILRKIAFKKLASRTPSYLRDFSVIRYRFQTDKGETLIIYLDYFSLSFVDFIEKYREIYGSDLPDLSTLNDIPASRSGDGGFPDINATPSMPKLKKKLSETNHSIIIRDLFLL